MNSSINHKKNFSKAFLSNIVKSGLIIAIISLGFQGHAQMQGTYTIGGDSPDYATVSEAVDMLSTLGVSGEVELAIRPGVYNEQITIPSISGASPTNRIIFRSEVGDSSSVVLESAQAYVIRLNGANYINFEQVTIQSSNTNCRLMELEWGAGNNRIEGCHLRGVFRGNNTLLYTSPNSRDSTQVVKDNFFEWGSYGLAFSGISVDLTERGHIIQNNVFIDQVRGAINMEYTALATLENNFISTKEVHSIFKICYGIRVSHNREGGQIRSNTVLVDADFDFYRGILFYSCFGIDESYFLVENNIINDRSGVELTNATGGLTVDGVEYFKVFSNSIQVEGEALISSLSESLN
jgi:hypothetical protein